MGVVLKTYHYVYQTTNLMNQKIYIGKHSTNELDDGYLGSGSILIKAVKKYGRSNFKKEVLKFFTEEEKAYQYEADLVTKEFVLEETNYNYKL